MSDNNERPSQPPAHLSLEAQIEALLFVSSIAATPRQIAEALNQPVAEIQQALETLNKQLVERGIRLQESKGRFQLTTAPELAEYIETFLNLDSTARFSAAALETLAIIAYQQPVTRPSIDAIRGVNSDSVIKNLLIKGLLEEIGRSEGPGRPILYGTSPEFLQYFGLSSLKDLPPIDLPLPQISRITTEPAQQELPLDNHLLKE